MSPVTTGYHQSSNKNLKMSANFQLPHFLFSFFVSKHGKASAYFWNKYQETALSLLFVFSFYSEITMKEHDWSQAGVFPVGCKGL